MNRRSFLAAAAGALVMPGVGVSQPAPGSAGPRRRVAVIGHTGRGNYGHGLDTVWVQLPDTEIVAVADADAAGLAGELKKLKLAPGAGHADYRKMLGEARAEFVAVAPRHADQHFDMALAAIEAGARGVYVEKPFCRTPAEADGLIAACEKHGARIAVAHRNRYHPVLQVIREMVAAGEIGRLQQVRGRGKGDRRGGGEDLWVLGSHIVNLFQYFLGDPVSCSAVVLRSGKAATAADIVEGAEGLGLIAGDAVHARYVMADGAIVYYDSIANDDTEGDAYCLQLIGSRGVIALHIDKDPVAHLAPGNPYKPALKAEPWIPITSAGPGRPEPHPDVVAQVHNHVLAVRDLIEACDAGRAPLCDVHAGAMTVEMICAVFESHRQGGRAVTFPLAERGSPLAAMRGEGA